MDIITYDEAVRRTGKTRATLWRWQKDGQMPPTMKVGPNSVGWRSDQFDAWITDPEGWRAAAAA